MMKVFVSAVAASLFGLSSAVAQDTPLPEISEMVGPLSGQEGRATGFFRSFFDPSTPRFFTDEGSYAVELAVDRDALRRIKECTHDDSPFEEPAKTCRAEIEAEMKVVGGTITLVVFSAAFPD